MAYVELANKQLYLPFFFSKINLHKNELKSIEIRISPIILSKLPKKYVELRVGIWECLKSIYQALCTLCHVSMQTLVLTSVVILLLQI